MGTWGPGIRQDDYVVDIQDEFKTSLKDGKSLAEASKTVLESHSDDFGDTDYEPLLWIALAEVQWKYGALENEVLNKVQTIVATGAGMERYGEVSDKGYKQRKAKLDQFLATISEPNPKPSRIPKCVIRKPKFSPGICLAAQLEDGRYTAALVLATDHSNPEYGKDLVGVLDYLEDEPPPLNVFEERK